MLIEEPEYKYCLRACFGSLGHQCVAVLALCLLAARIQGTLVRLGVRRCMETVLVQKQHSYIYSHTYKLKSPLRTGSTGELSISWWHFMALYGSQLRNSSEPTIRELNWI